MTGAITSPTSLRQLEGAGVPSERSEQNGPGAPAQAGRLLSALYFIAMALGVNALYTLRHPEAYDGMADLAVLAPYEWLLREVIRPLATPSTLLLTAFERTVPELLRGRRR